MSTQKNLITLCFAAVFTLGLAACGGGGGGDAPVTDMNGAPPGMDKDEPAAPTVAELFATAQDSRDASSAAAETAGDAVKAAMEASEKLTTLMVKGDSMAATANAQAVLDMQAATVTAATDAETALQEAKDALEDATEHAADNASLMAALDAAIKAAEADVKTATDARDGDALKDAVALVTVDEDEPMSAADHGQMVAMAIGGALGPTNLNDGSGMRVAALANEPALEAMNAVSMNDHTGKTWAEIVGETSKKRIGVDGMTTTSEVDAASIAGMTLTSTRTATVAEMFEDNGVQVDAPYKGIDGTAFCQGSDCKVEDVAGEDNAGVRKFTGSWYFTPDSPKAYYEKVGDATMYTPETNYAQFGHWLAVTDAGVVTVHTFAGGGVDGTTTANLALTVNVADGATTLLDKSATYEGTAAGMSLHKEVDGDGVAVPGTIQSGAFTADVTLTAKFGTLPTLGGYINEFEGNAVDPDWRVTLVQGAFADATLAEGATTTPNGQDGEWSAQGYGEDGERPVGIFGGFNAHFSDGHAAGAYATRK